MPHIANFIPAAANVSIAWRYRKFNTSLLYNFTGEYITSFNANPALRQYRESFKTVNLGVAGEVHPRVAAAFDLPRGVFAFELSVAELLRPGSKTFDTDEAVQSFMKSRQIPVRDPEWLFGNLYPYRIIIFTGSNLELASKETGITLPNSSQAANLPTRSRTLPISHGSSIRRSRRWS